MFRSRLARMAATLAAVALVTAACGDSASTSITTPSTTVSPAESTAVVSVEQFMFQPGDVSVAAGESVTWTNSDRILHTVTAGTPDEPAADVFDRALEGRDATTTITFDEEGTFAYFCSRHPHMRGTITVGTGS